MNGKRIIIAGGTGFIGRAIARELANRGADVVILTRHAKASPSVSGHVAWDGKTLGDWTRELDGADAVINLAGKNVNCRYTPEALAEIDESRVHAVTAMNTAIAQSKQPPRVLIQAATTAIIMAANSDFIISVPPERLLRARRTGRRRSCRRPGVQEMCEVDRGPADCG